MRTWAIALVLTAACHGNTPAESAPRASGGNAASDFEGSRASAPLDAYLSDLFRKSGAPAMSVGLVHERELVWSRGYGVREPGSPSPSAVDADTVYRIGSITKAFTATLAVLLEERGALALGVPLTTYIPEFSAVVAATSDAPAVTMLDLLMHTSGLPDVGDPGTEAITAGSGPPSEASVLSSLKGLRLLYATGERWSYSGVGYGLAGIAIARATKTTYREAINDRLLRPLGMSHTVWAPEAADAEHLTPGYERTDQGTLRRVPFMTFGAMEPAGGLYSTVRDMARFLALNLDAWPPRSGDDPGPISRHALRRMHRTAGVTRLARENGETPMGYGGFGLSWQTGYVCGIGPTLAYGGGTEGHSALVFAFPASKVAMVILANLSEVSWKGVSLDVFRILRSSGAIPAPTPTPDSPPDSTLCSN